MSHPMRTRRPAANAVWLLALFMVTAGCAAPEDAIPLPGVKGAGDSGYSVQVELPTAANLVKYSEVKVRDVTVGTVQSIGVEDWHAVATISLKNSVELPKNTHARIGQKSLLGAEYLELTEPSAGAEGRLADGDVIPLSRAGNYPATEDLLASISTLLNGGGLSNIGNIIAELNAAFAGGGEAASDVLRELAELATTLSEQRGNIARLITATDVLAGSLESRSDDIADSLSEISQGVAVLEDEKGNLVDALAALDDLSRVGNQVVKDNSQEVLADVKALSRITDKLVEAGDALPRSLDTLGTVLFPVSAIGDVIRGDYLNIAATIDVSLPALERGLFPSASSEEALRLLLNSLGILPALDLPDTATTPLGSPTAGAAESTPVPAPNRLPDVLRPLEAEKPPSSTSPQLLDHLRELLGGGR